MILLRSGLALLSVLSSGWLPIPGAAIAQEEPPGSTAPDGAEEAVDEAAPVVSGALPEGELGAALGPILQASAVRRSTFGVQVVDVRTGEEVFSVQPDRPLLPASTTKLVTSAAALDVLGPSYTFTTDVFVDGPISGGVLDGNLYIQGHADPTLMAEKLWRILKDVRNDGVDRVRGNLIFDESFFDEDYLIPGWDNEDDLSRGVTYFPPVGALASDFGAVTLIVRPGAEAGAKAVVEPATAAPGYVVVDNDLVTAREGTRNRISFVRRVKSDRIEYAVSGTIALDSDTKQYRHTYRDPTAYTMAVVRGLLAEVGITIDGALQRGEVPSTGARRIHRLYSPPLASVLSDTNKYSSNYMAEMVLRTLGAEKGGKGTTEEGVRVVGAYLDRIGVPRSDWTIRNGSGLSRETRIAPSVLTAVLLDMAHNRRVGPEFASSLSIAGKDGTLTSRMEDIAGRVRGKTGTLGGVHCLAGFAEGPAEGMYAFAFFVNDIRGSVDSVKAVQDDFLRELVESEEGGR
jgi:D-alanyl-D-alanine carboxypeptidase/D-alanyl-D-alanine-endopeptidase (penicillin-binding protein 4)